MFKKITSQLGGHQPAKSTQKEKLQEPLLSPEDPGSQDRFADGHASQSAPTAPAGAVPLAPRNLPAEQVTVKLLSHAIASATHWSPQVAKSFDAIAKQVSGSGVKMWTVLKDPEFLRKNVDGKFALGQSPMGFAGLLKVFVAVEHRVRGPIQVICGPAEGHVRMSYATHSFKVEANNSTQSLRDIRLQTSGIVGEQHFILNAEGQWAFASKDYSRSIAGAGVLQLDAGKSTLEGTFEVGQSAVLRQGDRGERHGVFSGIADYLIFTAPASSEKPELRIIVHQEQKKGAHISMEEGKHVLGDVQGSLVPAHPEKVQELKAQVKALQREIQSLRAQAGAPASTASTPPRAGRPPKNPRG